MRSLALAAWLIAIAVARILAAWPQIGITYDEPAHLACGIEYLSRHTYQLEPQHPPLARAAAAFGPFLAGVRPGGHRLYGEPTASPSSIRMDSVRRHLLLDRAGILPFFVLACVVVYLWSRRHFGGGAGALAVALFTLTPPILAHAGLGTTDMALTACLGAAFLALLVWAEQPTLRHGLFFGACAGLAALSKFTALVYFPAAAAFALLAWLAARVRSGEWDAVAAAHSRAPRLLCPGGPHRRHRHLGGLPVCLRPRPRLEHLPARAAVLRRHQPGSLP